MSFLRRRRDDVAEPVPEIPVGPVPRGEVAQRLQALSPGTAGPLADGLLPTLRYAIRREPDAGIDVACSKFGGAPDLPTGSFWPSWTPAGSEKRYLQFFAQLDLAQATAAAPADLGLPKAGVLSFFADFDPEDGTVPASDGVTVLYSPADALFTRCGLRMLPVATAQLCPLGRWTWPAQNDGVHLEAFDEEQESRLQAQAPEHYQVTARHQLGGHVPGADGFVLLQFDSDPTMEVAWGPGGSAGRLVWTLSAADIASRNWAAARLSLVATG